MVGVVVIAAIATAWVVLEQRRAFQRQTPEHAVAVIQAMATVEDVTANQAFLTPQGKRLVTHLLNQRKGPSKDEATVWSEPEVRGNECFVPFERGEGGGYLRLRQGDVWKFDDMVMTRLDGQAIDISLAFAMEHPLQAALKVGWQSVDWERGMRMGSWPSPHSSLRRRCWPWSFVVGC